MKIKAIVRFEDHERVFPIACGSGNKNFKWLGNVASQRYAMSAPNGSLRSRDDYCGEAPTPTDSLQDFLRDGNAIIVTLCSKMHIKNTTETPHPSSWSTLAYSASQDHLTADLQEVNEEEEEKLEEETLLEGLTYNSSSTHLGEDFNNDNPNAFHTTAEMVAKRRAKINYMKILLHSQLLDTQKIGNYTQSLWSRIALKLPLIRSPDDHEAFLALIGDFWDIFGDLFDNYTSSTAAGGGTGNTGLPSSTGDGSAGRGDDRIGLEHFICVVEDAGIFPAVIIMQQATLIYTLVMKQTQLTGGYHSHGSTGTGTGNFISGHHVAAGHSAAAHVEGPGLDFDGFLLALILTAQLKYNDTLDARQTTRLVLNQHLISLPASSTSSAASYNLFPHALTTPGSSYHGVAYHTSGGGGGGGGAGHHHGSSSSSSPSALRTTQTLSSPSTAFKHLITHYFLPLARRLECYNYLRVAFLSDEMQYRLRDYYETLQGLFDKTAMKIRDFPTTIPVEDFHELLYRAGLLNNHPQDLEKVRTYLEEVRHGTIYGREVDYSNLIDEHTGYERFSYPMTEFTISEYIEAIARAGYYHYSKAASTQDGTEASSSLNNNNKRNSSNQHQEISHEESKGGGPGGGGPVGGSSTVKLMMKGIDGRCCLR